MAASTRAGHSAIIHPASASIAAESQAVGQWRKLLAARF
jgi:hypothetical protein